MGPSLQKNGNQSDNNDHVKYPSPQQSAYKICLLVLLLGAPIGLICGMFSVILVWRPFLFYQLKCGPTPGTMDAIFAPDFTFGNFTIAQARAIDISWNLFVGRGLQAIVGFASYRIVTGGLLRMAESVPMPHEVFVSIVFNTNSIVAVGNLATAIRSSRHGFKIKATLTFFLFSATFILALPTLIDISTGYVQNIERIMTLTNGTRLLKGINECIWSNMTEPPVLWNNTENDCSKFADQGWTMPKEECVQTAGYQWGFSRTWMLALSMFFLVWGISICGVWIDTARTSHFYRQGIDLGKWKAIKDLGKVMQEEMSPHADNDGEDDLRKRILKAAPVKYTVAYDEEEVRGLRHTLSSKPSNLQNITSIEGASDISPPINLSLRLFQLSLAIANIALNAWVLLQSRTFFLNTLNVYAIVSNIIVVATILYSILSKIYNEIYSIWVAISLDIIAITTQLHCIITMIAWSRDKNNIFATFHYDDDGQTTGDYQSQSHVAIAVSAIVATELILFIISLVMSSMELHRLREGGKGVKQ